MKLTPVPVGTGEERPWLHRRLGAFRVSEWSVLVLTPAVLFLWHLGSARALTQHEIFVAGPARQMVHTGDWLLPRIGDQLWLEKPPLTHWLAALSSVMAGAFTEASVRLPSANAGIGVVLLVASTMSRLFGPTIGFLSGIVQATSVYMLTYARLAESDMVLLLTTMAAICCFVRFSGQPDDAARRRPWLWAFWILIGLTNLSKGVLFGAVLTLTTCLGWLALIRDWRTLKQILAPWPMAAAMVIASLWPVAAIIRAPETLDLWRLHLFGRVSGELGYAKPIWYYLTTWPMQLAPWTPFLLIGAAPSIRCARQDRRSPECFVWWWAGCQIFLLSLSTGKHHHYLIHALPAMSPVMALGLLRCRGGMLTGNRWIVAYGKTAAFGLAPLAAVVGAAAPVYAGSFRADAIVLAAIVAVCFGATGMLILRRRPAAVLATFCLSLVVANLYVQQSVMPRRDPSAADRAFLAEVDRRVPDEARLVALGEAEIARHLFYLQRSVTGVWYARDVAERIDTAADFYALLRERNAESLDEFGQVTRVIQSVSTRSEQSPADRYTLYQVQPPPRVATGP